MNIALIFNPARVINPAEYAELHHWSVKWGVSIRQLQTAILETGRTDVKTLRTYLSRNNRVGFAVRSLLGNLIVPFVRPRTSAL